MTKKQNMKKYITHQNVRDFFANNLLGLVASAICYGIGRYLTTCSTCQLVESTTFVCGLGITVLWLITALVGVGAIVLFVFGWVNILVEDE
jgi:hypothetical protein